MKKYDLTCENGHSFQGHFGGICSAKQQLSNGWVECIECHTNKVYKTQVSKSIHLKITHKNIELESALNVTRFRLNDKRFDEILRVVKTALPPPKSFDA